MIFHWLFWFNLFYYNYFNFNLKIIHIFIYKITIQITIIIIKFDRMNAIDTIIRFK